MKRSAGSCFAGAFAHRSLRSLIAGVSWIAVLSSLNVSAQVALPDGTICTALAMILFGLRAIPPAGRQGVASKSGSEPGKRKRACHSSGANGTKQETIEIGPARVPRDQ